MDLGFNFSDVKKYRKDNPPKDKKCMECGKTLEKNRHHLYFQSFCSQNCKDKYVDSVNRPNI